MRLSIYHSRLSLHSPHQTLEPQKASQHLQLRQKVVAGVLWPTSKYVTLPWPSSDKPPRNFRLSADFRPRLSLWQSCLQHTFLANCAATCPEVYGLDYYEEADAIRVPLPQVMIEWCDNPPRVCLWPTAASSRPRTGQVVKCHLHSARGPKANTKMTIVIQARQMSSMLFLPWRTLLPMHLPRPPRSYISHSDHH